VQTILPNYGGYGVTVNTEVCGAFDSGSIPGSRPEDEKDYSFSGLVFFDEGRLPGAAFEKSVARIEARLSWIVSGAKQSSQLGY
jgi:hypothetical protein